MTGFHQGARLSGRWLMVVPEGRDFGGLLDGVDIVEVSETTTRRELAAQLGSADGVVSFLALGENENENENEDGGLGLTLRLLQALEDARAHAPVWLVTRGAVAVRAGRPCRHPHRPRCGDSGA